MAAIIAIATIEPTIIETKYHPQLPIRGSTNIPPWGAIKVQLNAIDIAPDTAEPTTQDGRTLSGSADANGIAPSEINERPIT